MDDLISKTDVVKIVKSVLSPASSLINVARARRQMLTEIDELESKPEPHWIPVMERLPETEGRYIVVNSKIGAWHVDIDFYRPYMGGWMYDQGVLAWMPLPEPYKGVTE